LTLDRIEARILLKNLLNRVKVLDDGSRQLSGVLTEDELYALRFALDELTGDRTPRPQGGGAAAATENNIERPVAAVSPSSPITEPCPTGPQPIGEFVDTDEADDTATDHHPEASADEPSAYFLNTSVLDLPEPPPHVRFCLDFGTAMSKATLVQEHTDGLEEIHVLELGVPADQEEVSETLLISSVYIDDEGRLWFGKAAVERSILEGSDGSRQRLDNIKRRLTEEGWSEPVGSRAKPTGPEVTYGDIVLAYLTYLTWTATRCVEQLGFPSNLPRRFAMPCLGGAKGRETIHRLRTALGEAQILADTFGEALRDGIALVDFISVVDQLRAQQYDYPYIAEDITEPLGVAGSIISWTSRIDSLVLVVDIGAGTSDMSLYRLHVDPEKGVSSGVEAGDSSRVLTEAGNHLDRILIELIVRKSGITSEDPVWVNVRGALELQIRDLKETLFNDKYLFITLMNGAEIELDLGEFLELPAVKSFGDSLRAAMVDILENVDRSWVDWVTVGAGRRTLAVALTGGGAELPMVKSLAEQPISINGVPIPVSRAVAFPAWLREVDEGLEDDYPRIAVSLGGARRRLIERGGKAKVTAGDITSTPRIGGYYTKGF